MVRGGWGRVAGVDKLGFLELEGKATPIDALTHPAEVATACGVLQRVGSCRGFVVLTCWAQPTCIADMPQLVTLARWLAVS